MSANKLITKCKKYDNGTHSIESCFPKTMSNIKKLFDLLKDCEDDNECDVNSPGFYRSFLLAIIETDVVLDSDIEDYLTKILNLPFEMKSNETTGFLEINNKKRLDGIVDKEFAEYYKKYLTIMSSINEYLMLSDEKVKVLPINKLRELLEEYLEIVIAFCTYINSVDGIKEHFTLGCKKLKSLKKIKRN
jgi:hypothetical protein